MTYHMKYDIINANQSGSRNNNMFQHAQRLEGETATAEYNPSTRVRLPLVGRKDSPILQETVSRVG